MSSITANERQVGGQHYKTGSTEHWDVIHTYDVPYLLGVASKYVARHHLKAGREDLEKAIHYQEKWLEKRVSGLNLIVRTWDVPQHALLDWYAAADMRGAEVRVLTTMLSMRRISDSLEMTRELLELRYPAKTAGKFAGVTNLDEQITREYSGSHEPDWTHPSPNRPGTPEDGGHHARQPQEETTDSGDETEEIRHYTQNDIWDNLLPPSLTPHEWQHRCSTEVQQRYFFHNGCSRWLLKPKT